jgi:hypothetical protein
MAIRKMFGKYWIGSPGTLNMAEILKDGQRFLDETARDFPKVVIGSFETIEKAQVAAASAGYGPKPR